MAPAVTVISTPTLTLTPPSTIPSTEPMLSQNTTATTTTTTTTTTATSARSAASSSDTVTAGTTKVDVDTDQSESHKPVSIETTSSDNDDVESSPSSPLSSPETTPTSANDGGDADMPEALQNLALAATSDLLEISPRALQLDTPTSHAETPRAVGVDATTSATENPKANPKGILRKSKYLPSHANVNVIEGTDAIRNTNERRKRRGYFNFFESSEIDQLGKAMKNTYGFDIDEDYDDEFNSGSTLTTLFWSLVILPVVVLSYDEFPYVFLACLLWMARWCHRFVIEEFSMRRNSGDLCTGSLNEVARTKRHVPPTLVPSSGSRLPSATAATLSDASPVPGIRTRRVRFQEGIKFPMRRLLRQPIRRIPKHNHNTTNQPLDHRNTPPPKLRKTRQPFRLEDLERQNENEADASWSLDSLMILRNYMKDDVNTKTSHSSNSCIESTPLSVLAPPHLPPRTTNVPCKEEHDKTTPDITATTDQTSKDSQDPNQLFFPEDGNSADEEQSTEEDFTLEPGLRPPSAGDRCRRESVVFFPQEVVEQEDMAYESRYGHSFQPERRLEDDEDEEEKIDGFHDGLFGNTRITSGDATKEVSRYRRRKPRDSLCFTTLARKNNFSDLLCPITLPQCPSDELEYLEQKMQEKSDQAVVVEQPGPREEEQSFESSASTAQSSESVATTTPSLPVPGEDSSEETATDDSDADGGKHGDGHNTDRDSRSYHVEEETPEDEKKEFAIGFPAAPRNVPEGETPVLPSDDVSPEKSSDDDNIEHSTEDETPVLLLDGMAAISSSFDGDIMEHGIDEHGTEEQTLDLLDGVPQKSSDNEDKMKHGIDDHETEDETPVQLLEGVPEKSSDDDDETEHSIDKHQTEEETPVLLSEGVEGVPEKASNDDDVTEHGIDEHQTEDETPVLLLEGVSEKASNDDDVTEHDIDEYETKDEMPVLLSKGVPEKSSNDDETENDNDEIESPRKEDKDLRDNSICGGPSPRGSSPRDINQEEEKSSISEDDDDDFLQPVDDREDKEETTSKIMIRNVEPKNVDSDSAKWGKDEEGEMLAQILVEETSSVIGGYSLSSPPANIENTQVRSTNNVIADISNQTITADSSGFNDVALQFINPFLSQPLSDDDQEIPMLDEETSLSGSTDESLPFSKPGFSLQCEDEIIGSFDLPRTKDNDSQNFSLDIEADSVSVAELLDPIRSKTDQQEYIVSEDRASPSFNNDDSLSHNELLEIIMNEEEENALVTTDDEEEPKSDEDLRELLTDGESPRCRSLFTDLDMISFDISDNDNIECFLSPHALEISAEEETMYRRDFRSMHVQLMDNKEAALEDRECEVPNQVKDISSLADVECILSPLPLIHADDSKSNDMEVRDETTDSVPSSPKQESNKENSDDPQIMDFDACQDSLLMDTASTSAKACEGMGSPLSSSNVRSVLSSKNLTSPTPT